jgi:segregation and condensation protein B
VNECQPFWKTLKERIASFFRNYSPAKKADPVSLSRFWPFSNSAKKGLSTLSSSNLSTSCELELLQQYPVIEPVEVIEHCEVNVELNRIVEAILFAANRPMTCRQIQQVFPELEQPDVPEIQAAIDDIVKDYQLRPIELKQVASGYRFQVRQELSRWVSRLFEEKPPRYSRALLETLAIIAYRQPVTRGEIEDIRGVGVSSSIIQTLLEREWIRVVGHKEVPGRPGLYGTTRQFLDYFNISTLSQLPPLQEILDLDSAVTDVHLHPQAAIEEQESIEAFTETAE